MPVRLQKFLAEAGVASRRQCEILIQEGRVAVNGTVVATLGTKVLPGSDKVTVNGKPVGLEKKVYIALNKPVGFLCTSLDTHGRRRVLDLLPATMPRLYTVGRLDQDSEGLLLLTNDGTFSLRLTHPRYKMHKTYRVEVDGELTSAQIARLMRGVMSEGERLRAEKVFAVKYGGATTECQIVLAEGRKRQIRRMMKEVGHPVRRLVRLQIGSLSLENLTTGQWRYLSHEEVDSLMR